MTDSASSKGIAELTEGEAAAEGLELCRSYLDRGGFEVEAEGYACEYGAADLVASDDGEAVLVRVATKRDLDASPDDIPSPSLDHGELCALRALALCYAAAHPEADGVRVDVVVINIVAERTARLRHLVAAYSTGSDL